MQPYLFPYLGYYQMATLVDEFVFLDDANFFKKGFLNRNNLLISNEKKRFTVSVKNASQNRPINNHYYLNSGMEILKIINQNYKKAQNFQEIKNLIITIFEEQDLNVSSVNMASISKVLQYLNIDVKEFKSSDVLPRGKFFNQDWLIEICKARNATIYYNLPGGEKLYDKDYFNHKGIQLKFIKPNFPEYNQGIPDFIGGLSIIDLLMHNSINQVRKMCFL